MGVCERKGKTSNVSWPSVKTKTKARAYHVVQQGEDREQIEEPEEEENERGEDLREEDDEEYKEDDDGDNNESTHRGRALTLPSARFGGCSASRVPRGYWPADSGRRRSSNGRGDGRVGQGSAAGETTRQGRRVAAMMIASSEMIFFNSEVRSLGGTDPNFCETVG